VSLQHYLYILSVALVLALLLRPTGVTRYASLWCPDFPPPAEAGDDKAVCAAKVTLYNRRILILKFRFSTKFRNILILNWLSLKSIILKYDYYD
ncbi:MAG: hypothetical protein ABI793_04560, partial [Flavobacterium sp.]